MDAPDDAFATAKANVRDTVKWLAATFAALAALVLAGSPFTGFGSLPLGSSRFVVAVVGVGLAALFSLLAWRQILFLLRPDSVFPSYLRSSFDPAGLSDTTERKEIENLRRIIEAHRSDLLPDGVTSFEKLEAVMTQAWNTAERGGSEAPAHLERYRQYRANAEMIINYAAFTRLHERVFGAIPWIGFLGLCALIPLVAFAWAATPAKRDQSGPPDIVVQHCGDRYELPPSGGERIHLEPVFFDLGKSGLTEEAMARVNEARNRLREHPGELLLLLAKTDTTGPERANRDLARQRGEAVRRALIAEGGIAGSRIFVAELPETDLSVVTRQQQERQENRRVDLLVVPAPACTASPDSEPASVHTSSQ